MSLEKEKGKTVPTKEKRLRELLKSSSSSFGQVVG